MLVGHDWGDAVDFVYPIAEAHLIVKWVLAIGEYFPEKGRTSEAENVCGCDTAGPPVKKIIPAMATIRMERICIGLAEVAETRF